jgi:YYY domain-containing protein
MVTVVLWWLWMQVLGLAALPLCFRFFRRLPDRGYAFARPLGLLLTSYVLWLGGSFGLLRNSVGGALFSLGIVAAVSFAVYRRGQLHGEPGLLDWLRGHGRLVLAVELLFAGGLALWSLLRAFSPDLMTSGGEKFMEIMFLNSIGRSDYFPPHDAWLGGYAISYYYFGYVMVAMLTRLVGQAAHLTFNVGLASLFALTLTGAFGVVYNLIATFERGEKRSGRWDRPLAFGFLGAILVAVLGNLEGFFEVLYSARVLPSGFWRWLDILEINKPYAAAGAASWIPSRSGWWWWQASRVINDLDPSGASMGIQPIDEFPGFSFLLGDMHPHVLALPFVLLALAIALRVLLDQTQRSAPDGAGGRAGRLARLTRLPLLVPLCLGALGFLNTWDYPIYLAMLVAAYGLGRWSHTRRWSWPLVRDIAATGITVAVLGFVLYLPFYIGFQSQARGILPTIYVGTRFRQYFVIFGPFLVAVGGLLGVLALRARREGLHSGLWRRWIAWTVLLFVVPLVLMFGFSLALALTAQGRQFLEGIRSNPAVHAIVGDASWPAVLGRLLLVKLRTWVMPLVVAALSALTLALLALIASARRPAADPGVAAAQSQAEPEAGLLPSAGAPPAPRAAAPDGADDPALRTPDLPIRRERERNADRLSRELAAAQEPEEDLDVTGEPVARGAGDEAAALEPAQAGATVVEAGRRAALGFVLLCAAGGLLLTLSVEYFYLIDNFMVRMNTIFKFYFQAWVLLGLASAFAVYFLTRREETARDGRLTRTVRTVTLAGFWLLFALGMIYPVLANVSRAGNFDHKPTLDGTAYLASSEPDDYAAIRWLNENVAGAPTILERPASGGDSYVYEGRVSALTGLPTLLGWAGHEAQWRGNYTVQSQREPDIETLYNTTSVNEARALLDKYGITYVYVGPSERSQYDPRGLDKFAQFMEVVYDQGAVTIYKK